MPELGRAGNGRLAPDHPRLPTVSPCTGCGNRAATKRWHRSGGAPRAAGAGLGAPGACPEPAARGPRTAPHPAGLRGMRARGWDRSWEQGQAPRKRGWIVGRHWGGTAGSVDNVLGDINRDLGSSCDAEVN